jgi:PAS domain S-box-containing protein
MAPKSAKRKDPSNKRSPARMRPTATASRMTAGALQKEGFFAKAFRASPHPVGITELESGRCLEINDACLEIFGFRRNEVIGKTTLTLGIWPDPEARSRFIERMKTHGRVRNFEITMRVKGGAPRQFLISTDVITLNGRPCLLTIGHDITERKQAEAALRESEQRFRAIYDHTYEFIGLLSPDGTVIDVNRTALRFRGIQLEDVVGRPFWETPWWDMSAEQQGALRTAIAEAAGGRFSRIKAQHRALDGTIEDIDVSLTPIMSPSGRITQIISEGRRITTLTQAQALLQQAHADLERRVQERTAELEHAYAELRKSEERTRAFLDNSATVAWMKDAEGRYVYLSPNFEQRFGLKVSDGLGKTDFELWPKEVADAFRANDLAVLKDNRVIEAVEEAPNPDGTRSWWLSHKFPYRDSTGKRFVGGLGVEITARRQAEDELRRSEAFTASVVDNLPNMVFVKDAKDLRFVRVNKAGERLLGYAEHELVGKSDYDFFPKDEADFFAATDREVLAGGRLWDIPEEPIKTRDGSLRFLHTKKLPIIDRDGRPQFLLGISEDITERKQAEETLRRQQSQLQDLTSKLIQAQESERRRMARDLHDDVSQRLAALVLDIASLEQSAPSLPESSALALAPIRGRLEQLSDDIHALAYRLHPSLLEHAGLQPAVEDHVRQVTARTRLPVLLKIRDVPASIPLDHSTCLFRVLQESLQNVVKHAQATEVSVKLSGSTKGIGLSVTDNGKGFDAQAKSAHQKGLGLSSMQERLRLLDGFCRIHSRKGDGTKVCAWIPAKATRR